MPRLNLRQFKRDTSYSNGTVAFTTPVSFPTATVGGVNIGDALASGHAHVDAYVFVDSNRSSETYTETGSEVAPYRTLSAAISTKRRNRFGRFQAGTRNVHGHDFSGQKHGKPIGRDTRFGVSEHGDSWLDELGRDDLARVIFPRL